MMHQTQAQGTRSQQLGAKAAMHPTFDPTLKSPPLAKHWAPDLAWETMAPSRIQRYRMGKFHAQFQTKSGAPVQGIQQKELEHVFEWAEKHKMRHVRGHYIEWPLQGAKMGKFWPHKLDCDGYKEAIKSRIKRDMTKYKEKFQSYDVINEPIMRSDYFNKCQFWWAHEADPGAELCVNENLLSSSGSTYDRIAEYVKLAQEMVAQDVPVHCLGIQSYSSPETLPSGGLRESLDRLWSTGLPVYVTEFGIASRLRNSGLYRPDKSMKPSGKVIEKLWSEVWNTSVSWSLEKARGRPESRGLLDFGGLDFAGPLDLGGPVKARGIIDLEALNTATLKVGAMKQSTSSEGTYSFSGFFGVYSYSVLLADGRVVEGEVSLPSSQGRTQQVEVVISSD
eukprot:gene5014-34799_t